MNRPISKFEVAERPEQIPTVEEAADAAFAAEALLDRAIAELRPHVAPNGRVDADALERHQDAAHGLAWLATTTASLRQIANWAERLSSTGAYGEIERLITQIAVGEMLAQISGGIPMSQGEFVRPADLGLTPSDLEACMP